MSLFGFIAALSLASAPQDASLGPDPIMVEYSVTQQGSNKVVLEGKMPLSPEREFQFQRQNPKGEGVLVLNLRTRVKEPQVIVEVNWQERTKEGRNVSWTPLMSIRRGETVTAAVNWGGEGRMLSMKVR